MRGIWAPGLLICVLAWGGVGAGAAVLPRGAHSETQGQRYWISRFALEYAEPHPSHPGLDSLAAHTYALGQADDGYVGPRRGGRNHWFRLDEMGGQAPVPVYASGLRELAEQIVADLNARGLVGVYVAPHPDDIDPTTGQDLRVGDQSLLRLRVYTGRVKDVRTFAADPGLDNAERVDRPEHVAIAARSPIRPQEQDLLDREQLDEYVARLNRHPGRVVDVVLTPTLEPGRIHVDYIVEEDRPWSLYSSFSDTGTRNTNRWRQRFGYSNQQLTGLDDVLRVDYVTDGFDDIDALFGSYEGLIPGASGSLFEGMRWRFGAARTEYSSEIGITSLGGGGSTNEIFGGETLQLEAGLSQTVYQDRGLFVDVGAGLRWMDIDLTNLSVYDARAKFVVPGLTLQIENLEAGRIRYAHFALEKSVPGLAGTSSSDFAEFEDAGGREDVEDDWLALRWDAGLRFEPGRARRSVGTRPAPERRHEIELSTQGQYAFDQRVIPQEQGVVGGLYTVRGYPQSAVAGDSIFIARAEYRYHLPLGVARSASLWSDWNLVLKGFLDLGYALNHDGTYLGDCDGPGPGTADCSLDLPDSGTERLTSVGLGAELWIRRNLSLRLDYGIALEALGDGSTDSGDSETHLSAIVRY